MYCVRLRFCMKIEYLQQSAALKERTTKTKKKVFSIKTLDNILLICHCLKTLNAQAFTTERIPYLIVDIDAHYQ